MNIAEQFPKHIKIDDQGLADSSLLKLVVAEGRDMTYDGVVLVKAFLSRVSIMKNYFNQLSSLQVDEICRFCIIQSADDGDVICREGDYGDKMYIVLDGILELSTDPLDFEDKNVESICGREPIEPSGGLQAMQADALKGSTSGRLNAAPKASKAPAPKRLEATQFFGADNLKGNVQYPCTVKALVSANLFVFKRSTFQRIIKTESDPLLLNALGSSNPLIAAVYSMTRKESSAREQFELSRVSEFLANRIEFFTQFPSDLRIEVCRHMTTVNVPANIVIYNEGDAGYHFYMIFSGYCRVFADVLDEEGIPVKNLLKTLSPGDSFGDFPYTEPSNHSHHYKHHKPAIRDSSVITYEKPAILFVLTRGIYQQLMHIWRTRDIAHRMTLLGRIPYLQALSRAHFEEIAEILEPRTFRPDFQIYETGQSATEMFVVDKGDCKVLRKPGQDSDISDVHIESEPIPSSPVPLSPNTHKLARTGSTKPLEFKSPKVTKGGSHTISTTQAQVAMNDKLNQANRGRFHDVSSRGEVQSGRVGPGGLLAHYVLLVSDSHTPITYRETIVSDTIVHLFAVTVSSFFTRLKPQTEETLRACFSRIEVPVDGMLDHIPVSISLEEIGCKRVWHEFRKSVVSSVVNKDNRDPRIMKIFKRIAPSAGFTIDKRNHGFSKPDNEKYRISKPCSANRARVGSVARENTASPVVPREPQGEHLAHALEQPTKTSVQFSLTDQIKAEKLHIAIKTHADGKKDDSHNSSAVLAHPAKKVPPMLRQNSGHRKSLSGKSGVPVAVSAESLPRKEFLSTSLPFSLVHYHINHNQSQWHGVKSYFRVCGMFPSCSSSRDAAETILTNMIVALEMPLTKFEGSSRGRPQSLDARDLKWMQFQSNGAISVELSDHYIVFCRGTAVEVASFQLPEESYSQPYPASCKLTRQIYCCVSTNKKHNIGVAPYPATAPAISPRNKLMSSDHFLVLHETVTSKSDIPVSSLTTDIFRVNDVLMTALSLQECLVFGTVRARGLSSFDDPYDILAVPMYTWIPITVEALASFDVAAQFNGNVITRLTPAISSESTPENSDFFENFRNAKALNVESVEINDTIELLGNNDVVNHSREVIASKILSYDIQQRASTAPASKGALPAAQSSHFERESRKTPFLFDTLNPEARISALMRSTRSWEAYKKQDDDLRAQEASLRCLSDQASTLRTEGYPRRNIQQKLTGYSHNNRLPTKVNKMRGYSAEPLDSHDDSASVTTSNKSNRDREENRRRVKSLLSTTQTMRLGLFDTLNSISEAGSNRTRSAATAQKEVTISVTQDASANVKAGAGAALAMKLGILQDMIENCDM